MRSLVLGIAFALACALLAQPRLAFAQQAPGQAQPGYRGPPPGHGGPPPGYDPSRRADRPGDGGSDQQRREEYRQRDMERRQQWMSPDDRRDLRRDIRDHGRDVYRDRGR